MVLVTFFFPYSVSISPEKQHPLSHSRITYQKGVLIFVLEKINHSKFSWTKETTSCIILISISRTNIV